MAEDSKTKTATEKESVEKTEAAKSKVKKQYVLKHDDGWQVKLEGSSKATKVFKTKLEAEAYAKELANKQGTTVVRQKKDGKFQKKR